MPWLGRERGFLTTSPDAKNSVQGGIVYEEDGINTFDPAPWIMNVDGIQNGWKKIWYQMREQRTNATSANSGTNKG